MALFAAWVLAPFAALAYCEAVAERWSKALRVVLNVASLLVAITSLGAYGYVAFGPARPQPAFFFIALPFGSLVLIAVVIMAGARTRKNG